MYLANLSVLLTKIVWGYSKWYSGDTKTSIDTGVESSLKLTSARSSIECTLRCQRKVMKSFWVDEKEQCFCVRNQEGIGTKEILNGVLYQAHVGRFFWTV